MAGVVAVQVRGRFDNFLRTWENEFTTLEGGGWGTMHVYVVRVEGSAGADWLQATAGTAEEAEAAVRAVLMPGVRVAAVELAGEAAA